MNASIALGLLPLVLLIAQLGALPLSAAEPAAEDSAIIEKQPAKPDPQMQSVLDQWADLAPDPLTKLTPAEARGRPGGAEAVKMLLKKHGKSGEPLAMNRVDDIAIAGPDGRIPARIYIPHSAVKPMPVLIYWHGGGWVLGNLDSYDASCRALAKGASCLVISCDYRLAPEHPFPAAADDAFSAYQWVIGNIADYGGDPRRVAVAGESAGGNLAAVTAQRARDDEIQAPVFQLLVYPASAFAAASDMNRSDSRESDFPSCLLNASATSSGRWSNPSRIKSPR